MQKLQILSLGRNQIKKIEKLEDLAKTLEELWLSYNMITTLDGLASLSKLRVLYLGNNRIKDWSELEKLVRHTACPRVVGHEGAALNTLPWSAQPARVHPLPARWPRLQRVVKCSVHGVVAPLEPLWLRAHPQCGRCAAT